MPPKKEARLAREHKLASALPSLDYEDLESRPFNHLALELGQHFTVTGMTGSGKSYFSVALMEYLRRQYPKVPRYILDSTWDDKNLKFVPYPKIHEGNVPPDAVSDGTYTHVWRPDTDDLDIYNQWMHKILYMRKPAIVLLDDIASFTKDGAVDLDGHIVLMKQGRKHGITIINGSQEISHVSSTVFKQMTYFVQFLLLNNAYEWSAARRYLNIAKEEQHSPTAKYGFFLRRMDGNFPAKEYKSIHELFGQHFRLITPGS